jgi:hypothetical protein
VKDIWSGETCFVLASGPSLTEDDVNLVKGRRTIVTNTTFRIAPHADALFFYDIKWYEKYRDELKTFGGYKVTISAASGPDVIRLRNGFSALGNSGAGAIALAVYTGCKKVILLGADCQHTNNETHWHGNHPPGLGNAMSFRKWPAQFERAKKKADENGCVVLNASRVSVLDCFEKVNLEDVI